MSDLPYALELSPDSELEFTLTRSGDQDARCTMTLHHPGTTDEYLAFKVRRKTSVCLWVGSLKVCGYLQTARKKRGRGSRERKRERARERETIRKTGNRNLSALCVCVFLLSSGCLWGVVDVVPPRQILQHCATMCYPW